MKKMPTAQELGQQTWELIEHILPLWLKLKVELLLVHTAFQQVGAGRHECTEGRENQRKVICSRNLLTRYGSIKNLCAKYEEILVLLQQLSCRFTQI